MTTQIIHPMTTQHSIRIFLVDDDPFFLASLGKQLSNMGFSDVHEFDNGIDCLNALPLQPNVVFLDHHMDTLSGYDVLKKIKRFSPDMFVVMISGQEEIKTAVDSLKHGAFDYILKSDVSEESIGNTLAKIDQILEMQEREKPSFLKTIFSFF